MEPLSSALAVLTAMITPAVLISACGALILSTSTRLGRVVDRVRALSDRFEELAASGDDQLALFEDRRAMIFGQLDKLTSRARILQRSMTVFYVALGLFVGVRYSFVPVVMGLVGASFLFYGSMTLIFEARLAIASLRAEMDFIWQLGKHYAPSELAARHNSPHYRLRVKPRP
jgi:hypothetical protein